MAYRRRSFKRRGGFKKHRRGSAGRSKGSLRQRIGFRM